MAVPSLYRPLDKTSQEIRLLRILPAGLDITISCTSSIQSLNDPSFPSFNALSYVWGDANDTVPMILDGYVKPVARSLDVALRHLRDPRNKRASGFMLLPLWIDAVCINQKDIDERNHQVRLMKNIYSFANRVLVWLGPGDSYTDWLFDVCDRAEYSKDWSEASLDRAITIENLPPEITKSLAIMNRQIMTRAWWRRLWVVQEFVLAATSPLMMCGFSGVSFEAFMAFAEYLEMWMTVSMCTLTPFPSDEDILRIHPYPEISTFGQEDINANANFLSMWQNLRPNTRKLSTRPSYGDILRIIMNCQCSQPRDYVYGCLSILPPEVESKIVVDYGREPRRIFQEAFIGIIVEDSSSFFQRGIESLCWIPDDSDFPSWTPDLSDMPRRREHQEECSISGLTNVPSYTIKTPSAMIKDNGLVLSISGVHFDIVEEALDLRPFDTFLDPGPVLKIVSKAEDCRKRVLHHLHPLIPLLQERSHEHLVEVFSDGAYREPAEKEFWADILFQRVSPQHALNMLSHDREKQLALMRNIKSLLKAHRKRVMKRVMIISKAGFIGVGSPYIEAGDVIAFLYGMTDPLILRPKIGREGYKIVGWAYISGLNLRSIEKLEDQGSLKKLENIFHIY